MANRKPQPIRYRRKSELKTNYGKRLSYLLSRKLRIVVRFTNQQIIVQLVQFTPQGDKISFGLTSSQLKKYGWDYSFKNHPAAYLTGLLFGHLALQQKHTEAILDAGLKSPQKKGRFYSFLKGLLDAGFKVPHGQEIFPDETVINGKNIQTYALLLKKDEAAYQRQFSQHLKNKLVPENINKIFEQVKQKIKTAK